MEDRAATWFAAYQPLLGRYFRWHLPGQAEEAADLEGTFWLRIVEHAGSWCDEGTSPRHWLLRVARNLLTDYRRREGVRSPVESLEGLLAKYTEPRWGPHAPEALYCADDLEQLEQAAILWPAVDTLGAHDAEVLRLRWRKDWRQGEIAARLGINSEAVKQRQSRAMKHLRRVLASHGLTAASWADGSWTAAASDGRPSATL